MYGIKLIINWSNMNGNMLWKKTRNNYNKEVLYIMKVCLLLSIEKIY